MADYDIAIVGGGINGAGIARDAAGRGLRVLLIEQQDLASGTSSASSKLIHGGLRYLEHGAFGLVREALREREVLLRMAPHLVRPLRIVLPVHPQYSRSAPLIRLGLFFYDWLSSRRILPGTETLDLTRHAVGIPLKRRLHQGFEFSDCQADDSRLVVLNALDAAERGAAIRTRTKLVRAERGAEWRLVLYGAGRREAVTARVLVNAAGPWAGMVGESYLRLPGRPPLRLARGCHIVVRKLFDHDRGYIFQNEDGRVVFALPFERDYTLIGTTDEDFVGDLDHLSPLPHEIIYLCKSIGRYLLAGVTPQHVVWAFVGVRALYDDGAQRPDDVTREYRLVLDEKAGVAPLLTVYGGKLTTYRRLAEAALKKMSNALRMGPPWTARAPLPGGDFPWDGVRDRVNQALAAWPFLGETEAQRMVAAYGTRIADVVGSARSRTEVGPWFGPLSAAEVRYLIKREWAQTADDILWRRSKVGLGLGAAEIRALESFLAGQI